MNIKHFMICLLWQAGLSIAFLQAQKPVSAWVVSQETNNLSTHFTITMKYIANENIVFKENPVFPPLQVLKSTMPPAKASYSNILVSSFD